MKSFKRLIVSVVALSLTISLTGCGIIRQMMSILNGDYSEEPSRSEPTTHEEVTGVVGKDGGVIEDEESNVRISIPQGALSEETTITAQYVEEPSYLEANPSMNFLGAVEFGPDGTTFEKPVEVSLQLTNTPKNNKISIFCYSEQYNQWDFVTEANVNYDVATFSISHFSKYKALDMSMEMLMKFHDLVRQAQATGQPDSWVLENFEDYLINEEHVMDIYSLFGGYWYEPCGLIIDGNYHINGKEGDPNQLTDLIGETNKVGNTYGLCHDGQLVVDAKTYKEIEGKPKEGQEIIAVGVTVYYKMIKPDIDLTASKKKLAKGESTTINIRCHYVNVSNYFDEFKDLDMDGYMLTIPRPSHFDVDKTSVLTNDGRASFVVTAKEDNMAETITVNFDVSGDHGVHAEGNITLNSEGYTFEGHIKEELEFRYLAPVMEEDGGILEDEGIFKIIIEYDVDGSFTEKDGDLTGSITISNTMVSFDNQELHYYGYTDGERGDAYIDVFSSVGTNSTTSQTLKMSGSVFTNMCDPTIDDIQTLATAGGSFVFRETAGGQVYDNTMAVGSVVVKNSGSSLQPFELTVGEHVYEDNVVNDTIIFSNDHGTTDIRSYISFLRNSLSLIDGSLVEKTTQTITVTSGIQQE